MVKVQWISGFKAISSSPAGQYLQVGCYSKVTPTEADAEITIKEAGDFEDLSINVTKNDDSSSRNFVIRKNGGSGNPSISITGSTTGFFEDSTSLSVVADDEVNIFFQGTTSAGDIEIDMVSLTFDATTDTVIKYGSGMSSTGVNIKEWSINAGTTTGDPETDAQTDVNQAGVFKNLQCNVNANSRTDSSTYRFRINGSTGNQSISIATVTTGIFIDTDSDTIVKNDDVNYQIDTTAGTGALNMWMSIDFVGTDDVVTYTNWGNETTQALTAGSFAKLCDHTDTAFDTTEANIKVESIGDTFTLKNLRVNISANTLVKANFARPNTDETLGTWKDEGAGTTDIFNSIDDVVGSGDSTFIVTDDNPSADTARFGLTNITDPAVSTGHIIRIRADKENNKTTELKWALLQGSSTVIHEETVSDLNKSSPTTYEYTLSAGETDNITDYTDLQLRIIATVSGGGPSTMAQVFDFEFQIPDAVAAVTKWRLRKNGGDGNQSIDIGTSTGILEDTSNTDEIADEDDINYEFETTATSGSITIDEFDILGDYAGAAPAAPVEQIQGMIIG